MNLIPENLSPDILYQDSELLILAKPALCHSVSLTDDDQLSIAYWLRTNFPDQEYASPQVLEGGLVNRLDFETSGVLIAGRSRTAWENLRQQFRQKTIKKKYHAIVEGEVESRTLIEGFISNRYRGSKKVQFSAHSSDRSTATESEIQSAGKCAPDGKHSLALISTSTGARHQVRVHCASLGHPLAGDVLYGGTPFHKQKTLPPFVLHAATVLLRHPKTGEPLEYQAPDPDYLIPLLSGYHEQDL